MWRDIVVGADRTLDEFQTVVNCNVGLHQDHLWVFGPDQDYWDNHVQYHRPEEFAQSAGMSMWDGEKYDADETTIGQMARQLKLNEGDWICYLFAYVDERRFYTSHEKIDEQNSSDNAPETSGRKVTYPAVRTTE